MNHRNRKGFLMTYVIVAMALMGMVAAVLTSGATTMVFRADAAYLQAVERNLTASGLAWARAQLASAADANPQEPAKLNPEGFGPPETSLFVHILGVQESVATVRINTSCTKGRRTLDAARTYAIELPQ